MSKKIIALLMAAAMTAALTACGGTADETTEDTTVETPAETDAPAAEASIEELHNAIKEAYGENYLPNMPIDAQMLTDLYGIDAAWVDEFVAEMPMIMTNVDTLIIVKPTEGNEENVLNALTAYYDYMNNDAMQYPMNIQKVKATQVFAKGGYVFYFTLGVLSDDVLFMEGDEAEIEKAQYEAAMANNQLALDAINAILGE